jgi:hypothetical protein
MRDLERELRALGEFVAFPPTPELAPSVRARLPQRAAPAWPRRLVLVVAVLGAALVAALAIPPARSAILRVLGVGAVHIEYVDRLPAVKPNLPLDLGRRITPQEAPFRPLESTLLGEPDSLYLAGNSVTLLYGSPENVRLLVTQLGYPALKPEIIKKIVGASTNTRAVTVAGSPEPAVWIEGAPHLLVLPNAPERLAANTLVWTRGDLTLRLEGAETLDDAIEIAESFR